MLVGREQRELHGGLERHPVKPVLEDRVDVAIGAGADEQSAGGRGLQSLGPDAAAEAEQAQARAVPCSGCGRSARMAAARAAVCGPMVAAHSVRREGVHSR